MSHNQPLTFSKMKIKSLAFTPHAATDFVADVLVQGRNPKPTVRNKDCKLVGGDPAFVVLDCEKIERGYESAGSPKQKSSATVYSLLF